MVIVALPIAIVTSYVLWQRCELPFLFGDFVRRDDTDYTSGYGRGAKGPCEGATGTGGGCGYKGEGVGLKIIENKGPETPQGND